MAIYLEPEERIELLHLLNNERVVEMWRLGLVKKKIESDIERVDTIARCEHKFENYTGKKNSCSKCGFTTETEWELS